MGDLKLTSASGSVTLSPENVAGTTTITVPSSTATLLTTSLSNLSATGEQKVAQAWVNFDGTGTPSISDSYNVSSITDNGTGYYQVNFTNSMANTNYTVSVSAAKDSINGNRAGTARGLTVGNFDIDTFKCSDGTVQDLDVILAQVFGDPS